MSWFLHLDLLLNMGAFFRVVLAFAAIIVGFEILLLTFFTGKKSEFEDLGDDFNFRQNAELTSSKIGGGNLDLIVIEQRRSKLHVDSRGKATVAVIKRKPWEGVIHISVVICGERTEEATTMLKSTTLFTKRTLYFHILAEDGLHSGIKAILDQWPCIGTGQVNYKVYSLAFPQSEKAQEWKRLFKPCASQRLFLPNILKDIDSVLYMDTDTLLLRPVDDVWGHFSRFNVTQLASMSPEGEVPAIGWYNRFARHPYYGKLGVNSGVMLMNLTRMRLLGWEKEILPIYQKYKFDITWGDQDILNILFHNKPELLLIYGCEWNYRPDHCMYSNNCQAAKTGGISVLHGNRGVYHDDKQPVFRAVYNAFKDIKHGNDMKGAIDNLQKQLEPHATSYCGDMIDAVLKFPKQYLEKSKGV